MRLVASGHTKRTAVAAFLRALDGKCPLDIFQNGAVLQADATHYDPSNGSLLQLTGGQVVASVDDTATPGISLHLASCDCGQVTASNEDFTHCVTCGDEVPADKRETFEVEASEDTQIVVADEDPKEVELELEGSTEASETFEDECGEGFTEEETSVDEGGWYAPGDPINIPEDKDAETSAAHVVKAEEPETPEVPEAEVPEQQAEESDGDEQAPEYSLHNKQPEDVSMTKTIKATASSKNRAASIFSRKLIASMGSKALAADNQVLTASDVLFASCPKCKHFTLSSDEFTALAGGELECGNCKGMISASHLGLTNLTIDRTATAGDGDETQEEQTPAEASEDGAEDGAGEGAPAAESDDDAGDEGTPEGDDGSSDDQGDDAGDEDFDDQDFSEDDFTDESDEGGEEETTTEEETSDDDAGGEMPADEETSDDDAQAPEAAGDNAVVDEFEATDGDDDQNAGGDEPMEEIDLLESTEVEDTDQIEVAFSSAVNRAPQWNLSVAGAVIATLKQDQVKGPLSTMASDSFTKQKFATAVRTALGSSVIKNAKALGFVGTKLKSPVANHVKAKVEAAVAGITKSMQAKERTLSADFREALVVVAAGLNRGFFAAVPHPMRTSVYTALSDARIPGAARIANAAFAEKGEDYAKALVQLASEHLAKPAEARSEIAKSILGMGYQSLAEDEGNDDDGIGEMPNGTSVPNEEFMDRLEQGFDTAGDHGVKTVVASTKGSNLSDRIRGLKFG